MTSGRHAREKEVFLQVVAHPAEEREAALDAACGDDVEMRERIAALLRHAADGGAEDGDILGAHRLAEFIEAIGDRYEVLREVGRGSMGTVFEARDLKHDRRVAVKILPERVAAAMGTERFLREVRVTAGLNHPHILALLDSGDAAGTLYYVMPFVEGRTMRDVLREDGPLEPGRALRLGAEVADALDYAHRRGVVHRDIKPENLMLADGHAVVMDFGIARARMVEVDQGLTRTGGSVGTPAYMSPEQLWPDGEADGRSDVYSLGSVVRELLTGQRANRAVELGRAGADGPAAGEDDLLQRVSGLPHEGAALLAAACAWSPADRPDAREFADGLSAIANRLEGGGESGAPDPRRWGALVAGVVLVLTVAGAAVWKGVGPFARSASLNAQPVIAVLPFQNNGPDGDTYFADGVTDAITARLGSIRGLAVVSRQSAAQFGGGDRDLGDVARTLGASHVLVGTLRREQPRDPSSPIRIIPELVRASDGRQVWAQTYDEEMTEVFHVQSDIAERVADALAVTLVEGDRASLRVRPTESLEAYELYLRARQLSMRGGDLDVGDLRTAAELYEEAIGLDPDFALAHAQLAIAHLGLFSGGADRVPARLEMARQAAAQAVELAPELPDAHFAVARILHQVDGDQEGTRQALETVLRLQPLHPPALALLALVQLAGGDLELAAENAALASDLNPRSLVAAETAAEISGRLRRYETAEEYVNRAIELSDGVGQRAVKATLLIARDGDVEGASRLLRQMQSAVTPLELGNAIAENALWPVVVPGDFDRLFEDMSLEGARQPNPALHYLAKAKFYHARGRTVEARVYFDSLSHVTGQWRQQLPDNPLTHLVSAIAYAGVGQPDSAMSAAQTFLEMHPLELNQDEASATIWHLAFIHMMAGDADGAIRYLVEGLEAPTWITVHSLRLSPIWDPLRQEPAFQRLVGR